MAGSLTTASIWKGVVRAGVVAGVLSASADLARPIAEGGIYVLAAGTVLLASAIAAVVAFERLRHITIPLVFAGAITAGLSFYFLVSAPSDSPDGLIVSSLKSIVETSRRTAEATERSAIASEQNVEETRRTTEAAERTTAVVKRETSDDPRKELFNMGISWNSESFRQAVVREDGRAIRLFLDGDYDWTLADTHPAMVLRQLARIKSDDVLNLFLTDRRITEALCNWEVHDLTPKENCGVYDDGWRNFVKRVTPEVVAQTCGPDTKLVMNTCVAFVEKAYSERCDSLSPSECEKRFPGQDSYFSRRWINDADETRSVLKQIASAMPD